MVLTRYQARQFNGAAGGTSTDSEESEVSFNPNWLDRAFLGRGIHTPAGEDDQASTTMADDRQERRIQLLESAVTGMTERFDELLSFMNPDQYSNPDRRAEQGTAARGATGGLHAGDARPGQGQGRGRHAESRAPQYSDYAAEQLRREDFVLPRYDDGKVLAPDMFTNDMLPKPYMYLQRPGLSTLKKKLDARESMTFDEYIISYIKMIRDPRAEQTTSLDIQLEHLQQVVEDTATRDWPSVRCWSQTMFDAVEGGSASWEDRNAVQWERLRHDIMAARAPLQQQQVRQERRDIPCRDYNSAMGCMHPRGHAGRSVNFIHVCASCFTAGDKAPHPVHTCPQRLAGGQQVQQLGFQPRLQPMTPSPTPKNGIGASQQFQRMVRPVSSDL